jgi:acetolactate synthase-1/2/3 large subunit
MTQKMTAARLIAQTLKAYGITHVFYIDAIIRRVMPEIELAGITRVLGHSEKGMVYMADGYARVSGRPAFCMAQSVGAANLAAGLQDAYLGHAPVVALTGRHVAQNQYRNAYQEVDHGPLFAPVTKFSGRIETAAQISHLLRMAFREATTGTPRPAHLEIAGLNGDALTSEEGDFDVVFDPAHTRYPAFRPLPDPEAIAQAAERIKHARQPVIVADRGTVIAGALEAVLDLAQRIGAAVVATPDGKSPLLETHAQFRGILGLYGQTCANQTMDKADLAIYAGSNTSDHATAHWKMPHAQCPVIQIDIDPSEIGRNFAGVTGIQADVRAACAALAQAAAPAARPEWLALTQAYAGAWRAEVEPRCASDQVPMRPERICRELGEALPSDAIVFSDTGNSALLTGTFLPLRHPGQRYFRAAGSLGWAFPAALGGKCAAPDKPVICFTGDGGFYYHLSELETARRRGIKTITIVNNNSGLLQGLPALTRAYGGYDDARKSECFQFRDMDFARLAAGFDCFGATVEQPRDFARAFAAALASDLPAVIDVKTDRLTAIPMPWSPS